MKRELAEAFPAAVRDDARIALARFPGPEEWPNWRPFSVRIGGEMVAIPERVHFDPVDISDLSALQRELIDCLMTRHHDGFVRQRHLEKIILSTNPWIPPFVVRLAGEYILEILELIDESLGNLDRVLYGEFVSSNPEFIALTAQRVMSYWNQDHRDHGWGHPHIRRENYVGFRLMRFFESLISPRRPN